MLPRHPMSEPPPKRAPGTVAVHGGEQRPHAADALTEPIAQTATYAFRDTAELVAHMEGRLERLEYGRYGNPTVSALERKVAELEGTQDAAAFTSGMAALVTATMALTRSGSHVVLFDDCYRRTRQLVTGFLERFGVSHTLLPPADVGALEGALRPETRLVIAEAPTNPYQRVLDLDELVRVCKPHRVKTLVDSTFATPVNLRPADHGVDLVVHSATKYLGGHNDVLGGIVAGGGSLVSLVRDLRHVFGAILDPHAAFLIARGTKTLALRVEQQNRSALAIARAFEAHPRVRRVWYPGLESHPDHATASRLMTGFGGVVTFDLVGDLASTGRFIDACRIPQIAPSLGGVESLIEQPALMSYFELTTEERAQVGITDTLVRLAVGIEDPQDLLADLRQALETG